MKRIVFVGNSYVAAIAGAARKGPEDPVFSFAFYGMAQPFFPLLEVLDDGSIGIRDMKALPARTIDTIRAFNGGLTFDLRDDDIVVMVGQRVLRDAYVSLLAGFRVEGVREVGTGPMLSRASYDRMCAEFIQAQLEERSITLLSGRPRYSVMAPIPSESLLQDDALIPRVQGYRTLVEQDGRLPAQVDTFEEEWAGVLARQGVTYIPQPRRTRAPNGLTMAQFTRGSRRLSTKKHGEKDHYHMNESFGRYVLRKVCRQVAQDQGLDWQAPSA